MNNIKFKLIGFFRWFFGIIFAILALAYIKDSFFASLSFFLLTILILPLLSEIPSFIIKRPINKQVKFVIGFVLLIIAFKFTPPSVKGVNTNQEQITPTLTATATIANTPVPTQEIVIPTQIPTNTPIPTDNPEPTLTPVPTKKPVYIKPTSIPSVSNPTSVSIQTNVNSSQTNFGSWTCNCSKTCGEMGCSEAQYQLNNCGCSRRDADHDGVACDTQCQ